MNWKMSKIRPKNVLIFGHLINNQNHYNMKDFWKSWKFWLAIAAVVLAIAAVVLWFTCRPFCYATSGFLIGGLGGFMGGFYVCKKYGR